MYSEIQELQTRLRVSEKNIKVLSHVVSNITRVANKNRIVYVEVLTAHGKLIYMLYWVVVVILIYLFYSHISKTFESKREVAAKKVLV